MENKEFPTFPPDLHLLAAVFAVICLHSFLVPKSETPQGADCHPSDTYLGESEKSD